MDMSNNIMITGFGPFGEHKINASWESVRLLPDTFKEYNIIKKEVPVTYTHVENEIPELWKDYNPLLVIHVGVSAESRKITIEQCAKRDGYDKLDVNGECHATGSVCKAGESCIFTNIDVKEMCRKMNSTEKRFLMSCNAGRYLCEFIYYVSLNIDSSKVLFVHVPPLDKPYTAKELSQQLLEIIECALEQIYPERTKNICNNII